MTQTATSVERPPIGARVRITETYEDGTRITAEGAVTHHEPGVDHFVYVGERRYTMLWRSTPPRPRPAQHVDVQVVRLCDHCGSGAMIREGRTGAHFCDKNDCMTAADDRAWSLWDATGTPESSPVIDAAHLARQRAFSERTFGPGSRTQGVLDHIRKELAEIEADPSDIGEWVDVLILAFDGAWRAGHEPQQIIDAIVAKQARNEARTWPDWRTADPNRAIEHDRTVEDA